MGTVVVSADAELGWGFHDLQDPPRRRLEHAREGWRRFQDLCEQYRVPVTWAVVGHLFLSDCDGRHADHPSPPGWFDHERGPDRMPRSLRFGDGLLEDLAASPVDHDVGLHTFSHALFADDATTREMADAEVGRAVQAARERGFEPASFVFPRNQVAHTDRLAAHGLRTYRGTAPGSDGLAKTVRKVAAATVRDPEPRLVTPYVDGDGLVNVPASLFLFSFEGLSRTAVEPLFGDPVLRRAKRGIDAAAAVDGVFHMWLHPNNLVTDRDAARIERVFEYLDARRDDDGLRVRTMAEVAAETRAELAAADVATD